MAPSLCPLERNWVRGTKTPAPRHRIRGASRILHVLPGGLGSDSRSPLGCPMRNLWGQMFGQGRHHGAEHVALNLPGERSKSEIGGR